ncbi:MAG: DNA replication/repair protein RecF [Bacteroidaceae bacterium]|nr:DNA replication/repair protein RecF [Bacteroidaceae bacterium]
MILRQLSIVNYKNIAQAELTFSPKLNCLIGLNGEGKTNLLDAVFFLALCKSSTTATDSLCITHDQDFSILQGSFESELADKEVIQIGIRRGLKKTVQRNKKAYKRMAEHIGLIPLVMVSPLDQLLILGGSEERRRFMDIVISQTDRRYMDALISYNKALQQRNALLKQDDLPPDDNLLALWEEEMARYGQIVYEARERFITTFVPVFQEAYSTISQDKEQVSLTYVSHAQRGPLLEVIQRDRAKDLALGYSLHGVHRDDLEMTLGGFAIKREGSQGQNKTFLIALKLAQFEFLRRSGTQTTPLLLLDDIFDKLDAGRVEQIIRLVSGDRFGQIFITDTNREHLDSILARSGGDYRLFSVHNGIITETASHSLDDDYEGAQL